ncbi:RagB/SusD family nutrient uptake outer membrane protein [Terrimonas alba]|uniref:RagB/SusD family nutrient uptake outer membrane protein n=1 Tax=Terrimonas alba TaxID=3349636 RepID=UPI0035F4CB2E
MLNKKIHRLLLLIISVFVLQSCAKKLDLFPQNDLTPDKAYADAAAYKNVLAKIYGSLASGGNGGLAVDGVGNPDISGGLDEGSQIAFIRPFFNCQELPTDEAMCGWNDQTIKDYHSLKWTPSDPFLKGMYARPIWNITLINEYLRESTDEKVAARGITGADADDIKKSRGEVRFLRAFNYWLMMDLFGKSTFITEDNIVGTELPGEISRGELFAYVESELKAIENEMAPVKTAVYGRVDQGAAWALLARIYLNAQVYTGTAKWNEAATYAQKVINGGYSLNQAVVKGYSGYEQLFMADNHKHTNELIFAVQCDGVTLKSYGNTTFFVNAASAGDKKDFYKDGSSGWKGYVATKGLADRFSDLSGNTDKRALFTTSVYGTSNLNIPSLEQDPLFEGGLHIKKYVNKRSDSLEIRDVTQRTFADIDFPVFRLSEMYLIYAEAVLRGATTGSAAIALDYINTVRTRAYGGSTSGNITAGELTLQFVLDERARELYWEGHRRTDLVRYNQLTTNTYLWPWKGGVSSGTAVEAKYNLFPIPASVLSSNPNLTQNDGYN